MDNYNEMFLLNQIHIPSIYKNTEPKETKLNKIRKYYDVFGELDKPITINQFNYIIDGYARYIIAKEKNLKYVPIVLSDNGRTKYVSGYIVKPNGKINKKKEYIYYLPKHLNFVEQGYYVVVANRNKNKIFYTRLLVNKVFTDIYTYRQPVVAICANE